ncbi:MAG: ATP-binding protein [Thiolinea sp.]
MAINLKSLKKIRAIAAPRILVYGVAGIGKSTLASSADGVVYHAFEDAGPISTTYLAENQNTPIITDFSEVMGESGVRALYEQDHDFKIYAADSLSSLERVIWAKVCQNGQKSSIEDFGYGKGYNMALDLWQEYLTGLDAIRNQRNMAIVLLAHSEVEKFIDPITESYDQYRPDLHKAASKMVRKWADAVLFVNYKTFTKQEDTGFGKKIVRGVGVGQRAVFTNERPSYLAKNRYNLPDELPLDWSSIITAIQAGMTDAPSQPDITEQAA